MAEHIPFITSDDGMQLVSKVYADSSYVRIGLDRADRFVPQIPSGVKLWLDPCADGMDDLPSRQKEGKKNSWFEYINKHPHFQALADPSFHGKPVSKEVDAFVHSLLNECAKYKPAFLTVPQLPVVDGAERNKINKCLAAATGRWKSKSGFHGKLILPIIFKHQRQLNGKTARNPKVIQAERCYQESQAEGYWAVDADLKDESGSSTLASRRFPSIIGLHEELNEKIGATIRIAGPYWAINLVLWAKGLVDYPAIGIGGGYQYFLSGQLHAKAPAERLALHPLRRRATADPSLETWISETMIKLGTSHPSYAVLGKIKAKFVILRANSRDQVARFYKEWFDSIASVPKQGRSLALFQDLSAAYAFGRPLKDLNDAVRRPEAVAQSLMLSCL
jgi:hypothetical protein